MTLDEALQSLGGKIEAPKPLEDTVREGTFMVHLTHQEALIAATIGIQRNLDALFMGLRTNHGDDGRNSWTHHVEGAAGEIAVAKMMRVFWCGHVGRFRGQGADLGGRIEVRTRSEHWHDLIVRDDDENNHIFVLVTGQCPRFVVHGWIHGSEAKQADWKKGHGGREEAYFVPKTALQSMEALRTT